MFLVQLGVLPADLSRLWPILLIGLGVLFLYRSISASGGRGLTAGVVTLVAGAYFAVDQFWGLGAELFFPVLLASIGLALVLRPYRVSRAE